MGFESSYILSIKQNFSLVKDGKVPANQIEKLFSSSVGPINPVINLSGFQANPVYRMDSAKCYTGYERRSRRGFSVMKYEVLAGK